MNAIVCDKCGKVITDKKELDDTTSLMFSTRNVGVYSNHDLCRECVEKFDAWLKNKSVM